MRGFLPTLLCITACMIALNSKNAAAAAAPFDYLAGIGSLFHFYTPMTHL
jgi:hypothetical protein